MKLFYNGFSPAVFQTLDYEPTGILHMEKDMNDQRIIYINH